MAFGVSKEQRKGTRLFLRATAMSYDSPLQFRFLFAGYDILFA